MVTLSGAGQHHSTCKKVTNAKSLQYFCTRTDNNSWLQSRVHDAVSVALAGSVTPAEATENLGGDWEMSADIKKEIDDLVLSEGSGVGTAGMEIAT